jgi:hypothetical protein
MRFTTIAVAAFSLAFLAACDRGEPRPKTEATPAASGASAAPRTSPSGTPESKAPMSSDNSGKVERIPPVQGREDTRQPEQQRDFKHPATGGK